jgi:AcrR family transcriptional regulator
MAGTRENILELGEGLIRTKGYNAFSYQDISTELGIKNAAVHYYFPTKENLGTSIVKTNIQRFEEMIENMNSQNFDEWKQLNTFFKIYIKSNREHKLCIVGSLGHDFITLNETTKIELKRMTELIIEWLTNLLKNGKAKGTFAFKGSNYDKALVIFSNMVASLQLSRILDKTKFKSIYLAVLEDLKPN